LDAAPSTLDVVIPAAFVKILGHLVHTFVAQSSSDALTAAMAAACRAPFTFATVMRLPEAFRRPLLVGALSRLLFHAFVLAVAPPVAPKESYLSHANPMTLGSIDHESGEELEPPFDLPS
jgi:hypothetical protein